MADEKQLEAALLAQAAAFFSERDQFLGYWLERFRASEGVEPAVVARHLGCDVVTLDHLALCLAPRWESLYADTAALAERYGIDQDRLTDMLLQARATLGGPSASGEAPAPARQGLPSFAAASDREAAEEPEGDEEPGDGR